MAWFKRIGLFLLTNIAVLVLFSIILAIVSRFFPEVGMRGNYFGILVYAAIFGFVGAFFSLWISRWMAKKAYDIELLDAKSAQQNPKLAIVYNTVERIARENGITMPEVGFYEDADPNAFATGRSKNASLVAVSTGLLNMMNEDEIEGVVGHEMAHILNGDMVTMTLLQGVMNTFVIFLSRIIADAIDNFFASDDGEGLGFLAYNAIYIVLQVVFGFLAGFVIMYFSRIREYRADEGGARYTSKAKMIAGLTRLKKMEQLEHNADPKMAPMMITGKPDSIFSTHPSLDNRIKALQENMSIA